MFYDVHKENMFTTNLEDGREAPFKARKKGAKRLEFLVRYIYLDTFVAENIKSSIIYESLEKK